SVGQILMNKEVMNIPLLRENLTNTFRELLKYDCVPIVNENDSVETDEIKFGDNDTLSAVVSTFVKADRLIILTDIDALYDANPTKDPNAKPIHFVEEITDEIRALAGDTTSNKGTGGMITKIRAAEIATANGTQMHIVSGSDPKIIFDVLDGKTVGTTFKAKVK
ncbi:MAG: glutamate 5-kinase, partial [Eubacteriales bacterium]